MNGSDGVKGPEAFYIEIEARRGKEDDVEQVLLDIRACVEDEPETGPWFAVRHSQTTDAIFEKFASIGGRQAHVDGRGRDIFRDAARMKEILEKPAHVQKVDVLSTKKVFA